MKTPETGGRLDAPPLATYRLQLHRDFTFDDATERVAYLKKLGVDTAYLSPIFLASPGSAHGYDVCDPTRLNPELGGDAGFERLTGTLRAQGLSCLVDFVPNHMGADPEHNPWWRDVLAHGRASPWAPFFDIDWDPPKAGLQGKVLLPVLGDAYGAVLERGELRLILEGNGESGRFLVEYSGRRFPVNTASEPSLERALKERGAEIENALSAFAGTPGEAASFDRLHALLERQAYRLANWKTALHEINYRRFFDVSELLGLSMERPEVFEAVHAKLFELVRAGRIDGLRIDHIDGLRDPLAYLRRLRAEIGTRYLVVEKILTGEEPLRAEWPVQGTTGYEALSDLNGLFVHPAGLRKLRRLHARFTGHSKNAADEERDCKRLILSTTLASELHALATRLDRLSEVDRSARDFTRESLRHALRETIACLGLYRTYGDDSGFSDEDRGAVETALAEALRRNPAFDPSLFAFLRTVLLPAEGDGSSLPLEARREFALRFQQLTGPVQAKGVEDTVLYRQTALLSINEVGGSAATRGTSAEEFHRRVAARARRWQGLFATATHDTKRGEDHRARLNVLSEIPEAWSRALHALARASWRGPKARPAHADEYLLYQSLLGCWPLDEDGEPLRADEAFRERARAYLIKAAREAKERTSWVSPNEDYEGVLTAFVDDLLAGPRAARFQRIFFPLLKACAEGGVRNGLNQVAAKCASPGVPDIYQGTETWDLSLADPDNRRPVAWSTFEERLRDLEPHIDPARPLDAHTRRQLADELWRRRHDGTVKQYVLARALRWRAAHADLFRYGDYRPLEFEDCAPEEWTGFLRLRGDQALAVCLRTRATFKAPVGRLKLPPEFAARRATHLFTGTVFDPGPEARLDLAALGADFPTAWLWLS